MKLAVEALQMAYGRPKPVEELPHHSDRGSQYASYEYQELLEGYWDAGQYESRGQMLGQRADGEFLASLKKELAPRARFATNQEARGSATGKGCTRA